MNRKQITDWLIKILNAPDTPFSDVTQGGTIGDLIVQITTGERFTITVAPLKDGEDIAELQNYKNLISIYMEITLMQMKKQRILSDEEYIEIWSRISKDAGAM